MKLNILDQTDPIYILLFPQQFRGVCDTNGILEGIAKWIIPYFLKSSSSLTLSARLRLLRYGTVHQDGMIQSY